MLRPGGFWINLGPLLWHWADAPPGADELSLELPLAEVHRLAGLAGFKALRQEFVDAAYMGALRARGCLHVRAARAPHACSPHGCMSRPCVHVRVHACMCR